MNPVEIQKEWSRKYEGAGSDLVIGSMIVLILTGSLNWLLLNIPWWQRLIAVTVFEVPALLLAMRRFGSMQNGAKLFCPPCGKHIPTNENYRCGHCDTEMNKNIWAYRHFFKDRCAFFHRCLTCHALPESVSCPHCNEVFLIRENGKTTHPLMKVLPKEQEEARERKHQEKMREARRNIEIKEIEHHQAELETRVIHLRELGGKKQFEPWEEQEATIRERIRRTKSFYDLERVGIEEIKNSGLNTEDQAREIERFSSYLRMRFYNEE